MLPRRKIKKSRSLFDKNKVDDRPRITKHRNEILPTPSCREGKIVTRKYSLVFLITLQMKLQKKNKTKKYKFVFFSDFFETTRNFSN